MRKGTPVRKRTSAAPAIDPKAMDSIALTDFLRLTVQQLEEAILCAMEAGSWQAVASLKLRSVEARRLLDEEVAKASSPDESMSDEQLLSIIVQAVASMPPQHLERIEDAVELRRGGKVVRLAGGGGA